MTRFKGRVRVMPRTGLLDPQGTAVAHALAALGCAQVGDVRVGRTLEVLIEANSEPEVRDRLPVMCHRLLATRVTEDYTLDTVEAVT